MGVDSEVGAESTQLLLDELAEVGFPVVSLTELRTSGVRYRAAVPVLLWWLPVMSDRRVKEELVRALSVPWARPVAALPLIAEFGRVDERVDPTGTGLRWAIGNALSVVADDSVFDELVRLVEVSHPGFGAVPIPGPSGPGRGDCCHGTTEQVQRRAAPPGDR